MVLCGSCDQTAISRLKCSICKKIYYCNITCQRADWKRHKASGCSPQITTDSNTNENAKVPGLSAGIELKIEDWVNNIMRVLKNAPEGTQASQTQEHMRLKQFVESHPWPPRQKMLEFLDNPPNSFQLKFKNEIQFYDHGMAKALYTAASAPDEKETMKNIRQIGYHLKDHRIQLFHLYCVLAVMQGDTFFPGEDKETVTRGYPKLMEFCWDGVGEWRM